MQWNGLNAFDFMRKLTSLAAAVAVAFLIGCATKAQLEPSGVYAGDTFLYNTDKTLTDAKANLNAFVTWEMINRADLTARHLQAVTVAADAVRTNAPVWFAVAAAARGAYLYATTNQPVQLPAASNSLFLATVAVSGQAQAAKSIQTATQTP